MDVHQIRAPEGALRLMCSCRCNFGVFRIAAVLIHACEFERFASQQFLIHADKKEHQLTKSPGDLLHLGEHDDTSLSLCIRSIKKKKVNGRKLNKPAIVISEAAAIMVFLILEIAKCQLPVCFAYSKLQHV